MASTAGKFEKFGKYLLLERLATGGMAEVYLARSIGHAGVAKFVAIKRILPQFSGQEEFIEMFREEATIAINLQHSNIVAITEFGIEKEQFYIVMDFVNGRNLRQIVNKLKNNPTPGLPIQHVVYVVREVAAGLDYAHCALNPKTGLPLNLIHRDMSPQNVMVSFDGEVKIVDFGIAKAETRVESTRAGTLKGKFGYMSPEHADGQTVDKRTDLFSLGIVLWEMLANERLFTGKTEIEILKKVKECNIQPLRKLNANIPVELERICSKLLAADRNLRYREGEDVQRDLSRFLNQKYPDFSRSDVSKFLREVFSEEIESAQKTLLDYAKQDGHFIEAEAKKAAAALPPPPPPQANSPTALVPSSSVAPSAAIVALPEQQQSRARPQEIAPAPLPSSGPSFRAPTENVGGPRSGAISLETRVSSKTGSRRIELDRPEQRNNASASGSLFPMIFLTLTVSVGAFLIWGDIRKASEFGQNLVIWAERSGVLPKDLLPKTVMPQTSHPQQVATVETTSQPSVAPSIPVAISSIPSGAEIIINGQPVREVTPSVVTLRQGETVEVTVKKTGFFPKTETIKVTPETSNRPPIQLKSDRKGTLEISVIGAGKVTINGTPVDPRYDIKAYPVTADEELLVAAEDPSTGTRDQAQLRVPEGGRRQVILVPKLNLRDDKQRKK